MNVFDWSGPEFLLFLVAASLASYLVARLVRWWLRGPGGRPSPQDLALHPAEVGYLVGGASAAIDAAIAILVKNGRLRLGETTGKLEPGAPAPFAEPHSGPLPYRAAAQRTEAHHLEESAVRAIDAGYRDAALLRTVRLPEEAARLAPDLERRGLLMPAEHRERARWIPTLVLATPVLIGVIKLGVGVSRGRPICFLLVVLPFLLFGLVRFAVRPLWRTRRGDRVISELEDGCRALRLTAGTAPDSLAAPDLGLAVGLFGAGTVGTLALSSVLTPAPARAHASSGSSCAGGSSCGGGGGCGGGCGGCGG